jgi:hypothetical protein
MEKTLHTLAAATCLEKYGWDTHTMKNHLEFAKICLEKYKWDSHNMGAGIAPETRLRVLPLAREYLRAVVAGDIVNRAEAAWLLALNGEDGRDDQDEMLALAAGMGWPEAMEAMSGWTDDPERMREIHRRADHHKRAMQFDGD